MEIATCVCCNQAVSTNDRTPCPAGKKSYEVHSDRLEAVIGVLSNGGSHLFFDTEIGGATLIELKEYQGLF